MFSKAKKYWLTAACLLGLLVCRSFADSRSIIIDKIVGVVNNEIITLSDLDRAIRIYPVFRSSEETDLDLYSRVLHDLVNYKVVYLEYQREVTLVEDDYNQLQTAIISKLGSLEELMKLLRDSDMEWSDFKEFIKEKIVYEKILNENFQMKITVRFNEIEDFYSSQYLPFQKKLKIPPRSLVDMAPLIEKHLRKTRTEAKLQDWLSELKNSYQIEYKLSKES